MYLDPDQRPHRNVNNLKSTKNTVNFYCMDCGTSVETKERTEAVRDREIAARVEHASNRVKTLADKMTTERTFDKGVALGAVTL